MAHNTSATYHGQYFNEQDEELSHECRHILKTTRFDLDAFYALTTEERAARWRAFPDTIKRQVVSLALERKHGQAEPELVLEYIAYYDRKYQAEQPLELSDLPTPDPALVQETAAELARVAQFSEDRAAANAMNKAAYHLAAGVQPRMVAGDWLIPSATSAGTVYRLTGMGCSCEAGQRGRQCWHAAAVDIVTLALERMAEDAAPRERPIDKAA